MKIDYLESVAANDIPKIPKADRKRIKKTIEDRLAKAPFHFGKPLRYSLKGCRSLRAGPWRIIFKIEPKSVLIVKIGHRKEVYKDLG